MPTFDFIIVGGGTAGIVLASRLSSALPTTSILLIEAGADGDPRLEPSQGYRAGLDTNLEWDHATVPQKGLGGKTIKQIQGKVLGGSSAINVQGWTRGPAADFDQWAELVGDRRWSWDGLLPYFKKTETFYPAKSNTADLEKYHGFDGPIKVAQPSNSGKPRNYPLKDMVFQAYEAAGLKWLPDCGTGDILGYCESTQNTYNGKRHYAANCYKLGPNVTTWTNTLAEKLIFEGNKVIGVEVTRMGQSGAAESVKVLARKEVLVCSGVQGSAKLLLLSGVGPREELQKYSIPQVLELPVGENYSDHPFFHTFWKVRDQGLSLGDMPMVTPECDWTAGLPGDATAWHRHDEVMSKFGKESLDPKIYESMIAPGKVNTESFVLYGHIDLTQSGEPNPGGSVLQMCNMLVSPTSRGTLKLRSANSQDPPILDPNLLSNELDTQLLYACGRLTISMMQGPVGQKYGAREYGIDESMRDDLSDTAMQKRFFYASRSLNHESGTCAMSSVVDSECSVKGLEGVRVVDASIFPNPLGAHYQGAVYAVAEMMANLSIEGEKSMNASTQIPHPLRLVE